LGKIRGCYSADPAFAGSANALGRLNHLFEHCLCRDIVNLAESGEKQVSALLRARGQFIGLMKKDRFVGLLKAETGQRAALQLFTERPSVP
jgi:hypothetical protein